MWCMTERSATKPRSLFSRGQRKSGRRCRGSRSSFFAEIPSVAREPYGHEKYWGRIFWPRINANSTLAFVLFAFIRVNSRLGFFLAIGVPHFVRDFRKNQLREPHLHVRTLSQMNAIHKAHLPAVAAAYPLFSPPPLLQQNAPPLLIPLP